jgi:1-deoxyxylulose-5-phosphate synthase
MRYIKLGSTGLDVSPIAIGAMTYEPNRGHPVWSLTEEANRPLIKHALDGKASSKCLAFSLNLV